jgi:D-beta-D-heptose 7-phosphate kinase/D-beta-D-heptose 1-phosphate adenosyltransferase
MSKLSKSFRSIKPFRAVVLGDFFVDTYTTGHVKRISPEAPVQVLEVIKQESKPGGAGNAAKNIATMDADVFLIGRIGDDAAGRQLHAQLNEGTLSATGLLIQPSYATPVKNRLIAGGQQLLRVDCETTPPLDPALEPFVIEQLRMHIPKAHVAAVSDYGKGFLTQSVLTAAIEIAKEARVPIIVDPKGIDFTKYRGATILKPNLSEAYAASKLSSSATLDEVASTLLDLTQVDKLLITRSEAGISLYESNGKRSDFPVRSKEVKDVTGAGDTVLATLSLSLANGLDMANAIQLANIAAGIAIERFGCVQVTLPEIARRLLEYDADSKIFDENHTHALREALKDQNYTLLILDQRQEMTNDILRFIRQLSQNNSAELLVYIRGNSPSAEFVYLLSLLEEVDFIVLKHEEFEDFHPQDIFAVEQGRLLAIEKGKGLLEALLCNTTA